MLNKYLLILSFLCEDSGVKIMMPAFRGDSEPIICCTDGVVRFLIDDVKIP